MRAVALLALFFVLGPACEGEGTSSDGAPTSLTVEVLMDDELSMEAIDEGATGAVAEERREVITDAETLEARWSALYSHRGEMPTPPPVDFEEHVVVFASLGQRPTGGYRVELERAVHDEDRGVVELTVREVKPGPSCMVQQVLTFPYLLAAVEAVDASYEFVEGATRVADC
ncbi:MAG: protease complex subunit PrcB family protein [Bacteroidetes bacterium]|nr:protease complex subunit PrcB family protein [Bacteroidota bacterium]